MANCFIYPETEFSIKFLDKEHKNWPVNITNVIYIYKNKEFVKELNDFIYKMIFKFRDGGRLEWWFLDEKDRDEEYDRE